jgi:hypothetical protein
LVRAKQQCIRFASLPDRHDERVSDEFCGHLSLYGPTDNTARKQVDDRCLIKPAFRHLNGGEVGDPALVRALGMELTIQRVRAIVEPWPSPFGIPHLRSLERNACTRISRSMR